MSASLANILSDIATQLADNTSGQITPAVLRGILGEIASFAAQQAAPGPPLAAVLYQVGQLYSPGQVLSIQAAVPVEAENQVRIWWDHYPFVTAGGVLDTWLRANFGSVNWANVYNAAIASLPV